MRILFTITLFLSSLLLFLIEPMIAKMILPRFGGSPGVWNTSLLFFQAALLAGYGYAHIATKWLGPKVQALTHIVVLLLPAMMLPFALPNGIQSGSGDPAPLVLLILTISVGLPFLVVSAGAPLLQRWFAGTTDPHAKDPYFLYSASNLGSMVALVAYPFLIEPTFKLSEQAKYWSYGYYALVALMAICAVALWQSHGKAVPIHEAPAILPPDASEEKPSDHEDLTWKRRLFWIGLAFCPSSLLLGITTYLTSNIAPIPLLWVVPLAIYLLTFIIAFARKQVLAPQLLGRILPLLVVPLAFTMILESSEPKFIVYIVGLHLLVFFVASLLCHARLASDRPKPEHLTEFFFYVSLGGVLGGLFNALIAPTIFNSFFEYPLVLALACAFRPQLKKTQVAGTLSFKLPPFLSKLIPAPLTRIPATRWDLVYPTFLVLLIVAFSFYGKYLYPDPVPQRSAITIGIPLIFVFLSVDRPIRFALSLFVLFTGTSYMQVAVAGTIIEAKRSFFGVHRVEWYSNKFGRFLALLHGNTVHGKENLDEKVRANLTPAQQKELRLTPLTYYFPSGPIGQVFETLGPSRHNVAVVGLGVGSLAAYGRPGQNFTYYEIDPDIVKLASDPKWFHFVPECRANLKIELGDARIELAKAAPGSYDLIALDAFSSDSIPVHLITQEAMKMYLTKLAPGGVLALHISNRYLDLRPVVGNEAAALGLEARYNMDTELDDTERLEGKYASIWVVLARNKADFAALVGRNANWQPLDPDPAYPVWTDDYSNIFSVLTIFKHPRE